MNDLIVGELIESGSRSYVRCGQESGRVRSEQDVLDLLANCIGPGSNRLLLEARFLHPDFFDLSSGLAGDIFLKLTTYRVKTAVVVDLSTVKSQRFHELVRESNKGNQINYFQQEAEAVDWLLG